MATTLSKKHFCYTLKDFHQQLKNREKEKGKRVSEVISYKAYRKLIENFFLEVSKKIIYENLIFMMPYSLGSIYVKSHKSYGDHPIDYKTTRELKRVVYFLNRHTFGQVFYIHWNKEYVRFKNNTYYTFKPTKSKSATKQGIGKTCLGQHIRALANDPMKRSYIRI